MIHCLAREVSDIIYSTCHLFRQTAIILFSNSGAIPARDLHQCDFIQEHAEPNLADAERKKAVLIPHGVDVEKFRPSIESDFRAKYGIAKEPLVVITVGTISLGYKRVD